MPRDSSISYLLPYLDADGLLKVGGRLNKSGYELLENNSIIIPGKYHVAKLIVLHFHTKVHHQGRHRTEGAVRSAGFWITGPKRVVSAIVQMCVRCRRLRGKTAVQLMSDLPQDRLGPSPPFTYVGVDVFGPWYVVSRRTRGGQYRPKMLGSIPHMLGR